MGEWISIASIVILYTCTVYTYCSWINDTNNNNFVTFFNQGQIQAIKVEKPNFNGIFRSYYRCHRSEILGVGGRKTCVKLPIALGVKLKALPPVLNPSSCFFRNFFPILKELQKHFGYLLMFKLHYNLRVYFDIRDICVRARLCVCVRVVPRMAIFG